MSDSRRITPIAGPKGSVVSVDAIAEGSGPNRLGADEPQFAPAEPPISEGLHSRFTAAGVS